MMLILSYLTALRGTLLGVVLGAGLARRCQRRKDTSHDSSGA